MQKVKFAETCTKNMFGHNKPENKFLEMMAKSLDTQKKMRKSVFLAAVFIGDRKMEGWGKEEENENYRKLIYGQSLPCCTWQTVLE